MKPVNVRHEEFIRGEMRDALGEFGSMACIKTEHRPFGRNYLRAEHTCTLTGVGSSKAKLGQIKDAVADLKRRLKFHEFDVAPHVGQLKNNAVTVTVHHLSEVPDGLADDVGMLSQSTRLNQVQEKELAAGLKKLKR